MSDIRSKGIWGSGLLLAALLLFFSRFQISLLTGFGMASALILPFVFTQTWLLFRALQLPHAKTWYYQELPPAPSVVLSLNNMTLRIRLEKIDLQLEDELYSLIAPSHMKLGTILSYFIKDQNHKAPAAFGLHDTKGKPYVLSIWLENGWTAFREPLDPECDLIRNGIKENSIIIIRSTAQV